MAGVVEALFLRHSLRTAAIRIRLLAFASAAELLGTGERAFELEADASVATLRRALVAAHPDFERWGGRLAVSVEGELAPDSRALADGDEVALLPPVSGG